MANHNKIFLRNQHELLEKFKVTVILALAPGHPVTLPASSEMLTQAGGIAMGLDGSKGARTELIPVRLGVHTYADAGRQLVKPQELTLPTIWVQKAKAPIQGRDGLVPAVPPRQQEPADDADARQPMLVQSCPHILPIAGPSGEQQGLEDIHGPVPPTARQEPSIPEAGIHPLPNVAATNTTASANEEQLHKQRWNVALVDSGLMGDGNSGDSDYEDKGNGKRKQEATKADGDASDTDIEEVKGIMWWPKSHASPHQSDMVNPTRCEQCQRASTDCYQQQSGRGQGACYRCGKLKVKCSLKDALERPIQVTDLKPMLKQNPPMMLNPEPMMKPRPTKRLTKRKAPMAIVISDAESEDGMVAPPRT